MTVTLDLSEAAQARLEAEANRRGITIDQLVDRLAEQLPAQRPDEGNAAGDAPRRKRSFVGIGSSTSGRTARDTDEMLADGFGRD